MTAMVVYDVIVYYKHKDVVRDVSGPYFGSYLDKEQANKVAKEYEKDQNVLMSLVEPTTVMG